MPKLKKINLLNEVIIVDNKELSEAFSSNNEFGICLDGSIKYFPFQTQDIFIYQRKPSPKSAVDLSKQDLLGSNYQVIQEAQRILIKAGDAWQDIINYNVSNCDYNNISGKEVTEFKNEEIEDMSWMIIDFDVTYMEMFIFLEENVEITLLCVEKDEPYQFSYMGYFADLDATRKVFYNFCQDAIKDKLANDADYTYDYLDEDQREAVSYFKAKGA